MTEGWIDNVYIAMYEPGEAESFERACKFDSLLPGYSVVGLRGWQDFIVTDSTGSAFIVPTVPLEAEYLEPFEIPVAGKLTPDNRLAGKVRWLVKPLAFGGSPDQHDNVTWISHQQHAELIGWWNNQYRAAKAKN